MRNHSGFRGDLEEVGEGRAGESLSFPLIILNLPKEFTSFSVQVRRILLSTLLSLSFDLRRTPIYTTDRLKSWNIWGSVN